MLLYSVTQGSHRPTSSRFLPFNLGSATRRPPKCASLTYAHVSRCHKVRYGHHRARFELLTPAVLMTDRKNGVQSLKVKLKKRETKKTKKKVTGKPSRCLHTAGRFLDAAFSPLVPGHLSAQGTRKRTTTAREPCFDGKPGNPFIVPRLLRSSLPDRQW